MMNISNMEAIKTHWNEKVNLWLNYALVALALVLPLSRSGISILIGVVVILWAVEGNWKQKWEVLKKDRLVISIAMFVGWVLFSLIWTDNYSKAFDNMKNYGHFIVIPVMLVSVIPRFRLYILRAYASGIAVLLVLSILNFFKIFAIKAKHIGKAHVLMHHLDFSMFLAWTAVLGLALFLFRRKAFVENLQMTKIDWAVWGAATVLSLGWIFVQTGRSGQLAFVSGFIVLNILFVNEKVKGWIKKTIIVTGMILFLISTFKLQYTYNQNFKKRIDFGVNDISKVINRNNYSSSIGIRLFASKVALNMIKDNPVTGVGIGDNMDVFKDYIRKMPGKKPRQFFINSIQRNHLHNQYLQILTETGLVGMSMFLLIIFYFLAMMEKKSGKVFGLLFITIFLTGFIAEPFLRNQFSSLMFSLFMGLLYKDSREINLAATK